MFGIRRSIFCGFSFLTNNINKLKVSSLVLPLLAFAALALLPSDAFSVQRFSAQLTGAQEAPTPNASTAKAYGYVILSDDQTSITVNFGFTGLAANANAAHIHTGATGVAGPVTFNFSGATPAATSGVIAPQTFAINATQLADLLAGNMYFNIHNATFPGGEIRGQIGVVSCATAGPIEVESTGGTTLGTPTTYASLGAAFTAINTGTAHNGSINVEVCANTTEATTASLDASGSGATNYTSVNIYPINTSTITGSIIGAIVKLNGADNVTIDGRANGTTTGRTLTISNSSTAAATAAVWLSSLAAGSGATNNTVRNLELACGATQNTSTNSTFGIIMSGTTISTSNDGNDNDNDRFIANRIIRARYGIVTRGSVTNLNISPIVTDNIVGPTAFGADQIGKVGIFMQADTGADVSRNTVQFVGGDFANTTAGADRVGIAIGVESWASAPGTLAGANYNVTRNSVHDVIEERTFSSVGLLLSSTNGANATNNLVANNFVYNVNANGTAGDTAIGIGIAAGNGDNVVFNSVRMAGDSDPNATATTPTQDPMNLRVANTPTNLTIKNNSLYNDVFSSSAPTLQSANIQLPSATFAFGTGGLNNNNYFFPASNTTARTGAIGATSIPTSFSQTLANWQTAVVPQDANSIQADPQYLSATDLHIAAASPNVNSGTVIPGVAQDIDGQNRVGVPDIGADEPGGVTPPANDIAATAIVTPATGSSIGTGNSTTPQASFKNVGSGAQTNVNVQFTITGPGGYTYTNSQVISAISVDQTVTVTFVAAPTFTTAGTYTTTAAVTTADANAANDSIGSSFLVFASITGGSVNVGTGQPYTSLTNPGGVFEAINGGTVTSNVIVNITSDLTGETGTIALNEFAAGFTVTLKPSGAARTITGSSTNSIIRLNGADNVTIDGSLTGGTAVGVGGTASLRNLTVQNINTTATAGSVIAVNQGANSANNINIKNVNVSGQDPTQTLIGIHVGGNANGSSPTVTPNTNVVIDNCTFQKSFIAIFNNGVTGTPATGSVISHNDMSATGANRLRRAGIFFFSQDGIQVIENKIGGIVGDEAADAIGIIAGIQDVNATNATSGGVVNANIARNRIDVLTSTNTVGFSAAGIAIAGGTTGPNTIVNNMISGVSSPATSPDIVAGIFVAGAPSSVTRVRFNTIANAGDRGAVASQIGSYGIAISGADPTVELRNNIFYTTQTSGGGVNAKSYAIGMQSTTFVNLDSNFNDFWSTGANDAGFKTGSLDTTGTDLATLAAWQGAIADDVNSYEVDPLFVSATDPHLTATSPVRNNATPISGITNDLDGDSRDFSPDIGADEFIVNGGVNEPLYATSGTSITSFNSSTPGTITTVNITGLQTGEIIVDWDLRPANGDLVGVGSTSRLYLINPITGAATQIGAAGQFTLTGTAFGTDFNPTVDRIRNVSDADQSIRLNPNNGALAGTDTSLNQAVGNPNVVSVAYDRNDNSGATPTTLFGIDSIAGTLVRIGGVDGTPSPNGGVVTTIGSLGLGLNLDPSIGFDISGTTGIAYATISDAGPGPKPGESVLAVNPRLYTINLTTGAATLVGTVGSGSAGAYQGLTVASRPTASGVTVGGRVLTAEGRGLTNAVVTITDPDGSSRSIITGRNGFFSFDEVEAGRTYIISVRSRRYLFSPRLVEVNDNVSDIEFYPEQ